MKITQVHLAFSGRGQSRRNLAARLDSLQVPAGMAVATQAEDYASKVAFPESGSRAY